MAWLRQRRRAGRRSCTCTPRRPKISGWRRTRHMRARRLAVRDDRGAGVSEERVQVPDR